jgi:hypothetical protein
MCHGFLCRHALSPSVKRQDRKTKSLLKKRDRSSIIGGMARAQKVVEISTKLPVPEKNPAAVALGRLGGLKGGKARAEKLDPAVRKEIAQRAAKQRWANRESIGLVPTAVRAIDTKKAAKLP